MNVDGLRELAQMAAKLEATVRKLPRVKCDELLQDVERIRAQLSALLSTASKAEEQPVPLRDLELKAKAK